MKPAALAWGESHPGRRLAASVPQTSPFLPLPRFTSPAPPSAARGSAARRVPSARERIASWEKTRTLSKTFMTRNGFGIRCIRRHLLVYLWLHYTISQDTLCTLNLIQENEKPGSSHCVCMVGQAQSNLEKQDRYWRNNIFFSGLRKTIGQQWHLQRD